MAVGPHRGAFLPTVWQSLPEPEKLLVYLKQKAGYPKITGLIRLQFTGILLN